MFVALFINLVSAYLKPSIDRRLSQSSVWLRKKSELEFNKYEQQVVALRANEHEQLIWAFRVQTTGYYSLFFLLIGISLVASVSIVPKWEFRGMNYSCGPE